MEGDDQSLRNRRSRWNPTEEQINLLKSVYSQGLRTPTPEQIHQITTRLRDYGHALGRNVFYWFQNQKARQKQKQESFAYQNRLLHSPTVFPSYHNVACSPCCIPPVAKNDPVLYQQYPKVPLPTAPGSFKRSKLTPESTNQNPTRYNTKSSMDHLHSSSSPHQETLDLLPIHPTGILQSRINGVDDHENKNPRISGENDVDDGDGQPLFDLSLGIRSGVWGKFF